MTAKRRWDPCIYHRGIHTDDFLRSYLSEPHRKVLLVAGASVWKQGGGPWMFAGSAIQFAAAAAGDAIVLAGNFGELALLAGLVVTEQRLSQAASRG